MFSKWEKLPKSARSALVFGVSFLLTPLFTRIMDTEQYGFVTRYNSWHYILEVFALLGMASVGAFNVGLNDYRDRRDRFVSGMLILCNISTIITFGVILFIKYFFFRTIVLPAVMLLIMLVGYLISPALTFYTARCRYEYRYKPAAVATIISVFVGQGLSVAMVLMAANGNPPFGMAESDLKVLGVTAGLVIVALPLYILAIKRGGIKPDMKMVKSMTLFALPLLPHYLALHVMNGADRIMVGNLVSDGAAGIYGVASAIGYATSYIWTAINGSLMPFVFEKKNSGDIESIRRVTRLIVTFYAGLVVMVTLAAPELLMILAPEEYSEGLKAIPPIAAMIFLNALYNIYASIEFYYKRSIGIAISTIIAAVVNIVLNLIFIPEYGLTAAAYTTLVANAVLTFCHYVGFRICCKEKLFSNRSFLLISILCTASCLGISLLYEENIIRYAIMAVVCLIILIKHRYIIDVIKTAMGRKK